LDHRRRDGQFVYLDGLDGQISAFHRTPESHAAQDDNPLGSLEQRLNVAINAMRESDPTNQRSIVLMVDQIDLALALSGGLITSVDVLNMISRLRQVVYASVFTLAADKPLLIAQNTTLERQHSALVVALAHAAGRVISLRELDSGAASDVSGILRDSYGGTFPSHYDELSREYLYAIGVDGRFKATERC
jgi:elongator complex protein 6